MTETASPPAKMKTVIGIAAALAGLYFLLVGAGVLPVPGGPDNVNGPLWILLCAGLAFFLAGTAIVLQAFGRANDHGEFPAGAPSWLRVVQYLIGVATFASFGAIGSWIAFGPGERAFSGSFFFLSAENNPVVGRTAFGIGTIIVWICTIAFAVSGARKLFGIRPPDPQ
jgi:hypothetical protein